MEHSAEVIAQLERGQISPPQMHQFGISTSGYHFGKDGTKLVWKGKHGNPQSKASLLRIAERIRKTYSEAVGKRCIQNRDVKFTKTFLLLPESTLICLESPMTCRHRMKCESKSKGSSSLPKEDIRA